MKSFATFGIDIRGARSGQVRTTCPECSHTRTKSKERCLSVNVDEGLWKCQHCGWSGSLGRDRMTGLPPRRRVKKPLKTKDAKIIDEARQFLRGRGISEETAARAGVTAMESYYFADAEAAHPALAFRYFEDGQMLMAKLRSLRGKHFTIYNRQSKDDEPNSILWYGLDDIKDHETVIITEGEMDKLSFDEIGYTNSVSVPAGAKADLGEWFSDIDFEALNTVYIATDNDENGNLLAEEIARRVGKAKCYRVTFGQHKDANDVLRYSLDGHKELEGYLLNAQPYPVEGLIMAQDLVEELERIRVEGYDHGKSTGWKTLDRIWTVLPGELTVIHGIPNHGKTAFIRALGYNLAGVNDWPGGICTLEDQPSKVLRDLCRIHTRKPFGSQYNGAMSPQEFRDAAAWVNSRIFFCAPKDENGFAMDDILDLALTMLYRFGIKWFVLDPFTELEHMKTRDDSMTEYVGRCLSAARRFAKTYDVHVAITAHPSKMVAGGDGRYQVPKPYQISDSRHWYNKPDNILAIWRDVKDPKADTQIHVQKIRNSPEVGVLGKIELKFNPTTAGFDDPEDFIPQWRHIQNGREVGVEQPEDAGF